MFSHHLHKVGYVYLIYIYISLFVFTSVLVLCYIKLEYSCLFDNVTRYLLLYSKHSTLIRLFSSEA